ncbi:MAG: ribosomal protein S18-alanine N-acetyltransferase [Chloroflexi bacterium]|jgi:ribosomal-protein-alanine N-acetyltransferase|nr:ribosomal protein S18-alanine N-acetyltransferase [Chloroflexota bacterium]
MGYIIRRMQDRDIPQAVEIDREAFPTQWPHPTYASFKQELRNRLACYIVVTKPGEIKAVKQNADNNGFWQRLLHLFDHDRFFGEEIPPPSTEYIVGIAGFWVMVDEAHITTLAVRDAYRRQGIGERLLIEIIEAAQLNVNVVTLEARVSNKQAQALYQKYEFQKVGVRRAYYTDNGEDAVLMTTDSLASNTFQSHFQQLKQSHMHRWGELYVNELSKVA